MGQEVENEVDYPATKARNNKTASDSAATKAEKKSNHKLQQDIIKFVQIGQ